MDAMKPLELEELCELEDSCPALFGRRGPCTLENPEKPVQRWERVSDVRGVELFSLRRLLGYRNATGSEDARSESEFGAAKLRPDGEWGASLFSDWEV